jgi:hypothetical protein
MSWVGPLLIALTACHRDPPEWKSDRFRLKGAMHGRSCDVRLDGRPVLNDPDGGGEEISLMIDYAYNVGLDSGQGLKTIFCRGIQVSIASPIGQMPPPGTYRVRDGLGHPRGTASVALFSPSIPRGDAPASAARVFLDGTSGIVQLERMDSTSARGTFLVTARRRSSR